MNLFELGQKKEFLHDSANFYYKNQLFVSGKIISETFLYSVYKADIYFEDLFSVIRGEGGFFCLLTLIQLENLKLLNSSLLFIIGLTITQKTCHFSNLNKSILNI